MGASASASSPSTWTLLKEVVTDARILLQSSSRTRYAELLSRRQQAEANLKEVVTFKQELMKRRVDTYKSMVAAHEAKKTQLLQQFQREPPVISRRPPVENTEEMKKRVVDSIASPEEVLRRHTGTDSSHERKGHD